MLCWTQIAVELKDLIKEMKNCNSYNIIESV